MSDLIFSYSRSEAIADGLLADVSRTAKEAGFKIPVALTAAVWTSYVLGGGTDQSVVGRLWDVLFLAHMRIRKAAEDDAVVLYKLFVDVEAGRPMADNEKPAPDNAGYLPTHRLVTLKVHIGPGDQGEPVITIMLPDED